MNLTCHVQPLMYLLHREARAQAAASRLADFMQRGYRVRLCCMSLELPRMTSAALAGSRHSNT